MCCSAGGSSEQSTNTGHNTEVSVCVSVFRSLHLSSTSAKYHIAPLLLCREIMEIITMRRYRCGTSRRAQELQCQPFMPGSALTQTSSTTAASLSTKILSVSQMGTHFLTQIKTPPQPVTIHLLVGFKVGSTLQQQSRLSIL